MNLTEAIILTIITSSTPFVLAGIGELVVERSGVLNLGVEGMMIMGTVSGFAIAYMTGSAPLGFLAAVMAGMVFAALFAFMTLGLAANQVASGLALTILGLGLSDLLGTGFVGLNRAKIPSLDIPGLTDIPVIGPILFGQDALVYLSIALVAGVWWFLYRSRGGLILRAVGENHVSAHALGYPVRLIRFGAVLFGGACAGLGGAYLSLADTPFWGTGMTAGRGWIALALVVFASWRPWRLLLGAYFFGAIWIGNLHMQALGGSLPHWLVWPPQFWTGLPYLATVIVLVMISAGKGRRGVAPGSLGTAFVPDR
ncbi:ABC transporter permease [Labrys sp. WJW]|uniref:ABC transporter permease n=1 Tax=Labrys sp. WJW TaxID=1737983 RepID=UPI00082CC8D0|nr:ABC transporter permease [Labrys sp. WJW]OCC01513.1 ABC transporter permease [Labrys sp. WJW]